MAEAPARRQADPLRLRARLLEFLKFRVLAAQDSFFTAFLLDGALQRSSAPAMPGTGAGSPPQAAAQRRQPDVCGPAGAALDPARLRNWLGPIWPEALALSDRELQETFAQAHHLYVN